MSLCPFPPTITFTSRAPQSERNWETRVRTRLLRSRSSTFKPLRHWVTLFERSSDDRLKHSALLARRWPPSWTLKVSRSSKNLSLPPPFFEPLELLKNRCTQHRVISIPLLKHFKCSVTEFFPAELKISGSFVTRCSSFRFSILKSEWPKKKCNQKHLKNTMVAES